MERESGAPLEGFPGEVGGGACALGDLDGHGRHELAVLQVDPSGGEQLAHLLEVAPWP